MNRSSVLMYGVIAGIIVGLIISVFVVKAINKDGKFKTKYDEMQEIKRGRGFKYSFYAVMIFEALMGVLAIGEVALPLDGLSLHFLGIFIGIVVLESYCIFNDAFIGLNTNGHRYAIVCVVVSIINFANAYFTFKNQTEGWSGFVNLLCGIMFVIIGIEIIVKKLIDKGQDKEA